MCLRQLPKQRSQSLPQAAHCRAGKSSLLEGCLCVCVHTHACSAITSGFRCKRDSSLGLELPGCGAGLRLWQSCAWGSGCLPAAVSAPQGPSLTTL